MFQAVPFELIVPAVRDWGEQREQHSAQVQCTPLCGMIGISSVPLGRNSGKGLVSCAGNRLTIDSTVPNGTRGPYPLCFPSDESLGSCQAVPSGRPSDSEVICGRRH